MQTSMRIDGPHIPAVRSAPAGASNELKVQFLSESEIATRLPADHWASMPCGHDCCACNTECK